MAKASAKPAAEPAEQFRHGVGNHDATAARDLVLWLRKERVAVDAVQVGAVRLEGVKDLALRSSETSDPKPPAARRQGMYERYGGPLMANADPKPGSPAQHASAVTEQDDED